MNLHYHSHLPQSVVVLLAVGLTLLGPVALAQAPKTDADELRDLTNKIYSEANARYGMASGRALGSEKSASCEQFRDRSLNKGPEKTTAAERYEAALVFRQCVEDRKANLYRDNAPALTRLTGPMLATDYVHQVMKVEIERADETVRATAGQKDFMGMSFGIGVGVSFSSTEQITGAERAADNTVRVTSRQEQQPRVILEAHYYGVCEKRLEACAAGTFGVGPFFGLAATGEEIDAFALGIMFGWKGKGPDSGSGGFSIGIGAVLDKEFQELAPGFVEGAPLPAGETTVPLVTRSKWSPLLFFTKTF